MLSHRRGAAGPMAQHLHESAAGERLTFRRR